MGVPVDQISIAGYPYKATADGARAWTEGLVATRDRYGVDKYMVTTEMFFGMHCLVSGGKQRGRCFGLADGLICRRDRIP